MTMVDMEQLIMATNQVASFPAIVHRIDRAVHDPHNSMEKIGRIVSEDPGLTARLLKLANSSFFNLPVPVDTITRALAVIGTKQLRDLVISSSLLGAFSGVPGGIINAESFWRHSIACGTAARIIATARREINVERYYLCGLMHDIGRLVLHALVPEQAAECLNRCRSDNRPLCDVERELLGFDHGALGAELLRNWNLPPDIYTPIRYLHQPRQATDYQLEAAILHVADIMAIALMLDGSLNGRVPPLEEGAWQRVELPVSAVPELVEHLLVQFQDAVGIFLESVA